MTQSLHLRLAALEAKATKGPWRADWRGTNHFEITTDAAHPGSYWVVLPNASTCDEADPKWAATGADLDLTCASVNTHALLLEVAEAGQALKLNRASPSITIEEWSAMIFRHDAALDRLAASWKEGA